MSTHPTRTLSCLQLQKPKQLKYTILNKAFRIHYTEYCLPGHTLYNGKCYNLYLRGATFNAAEAACNKLNEGHLAAYHSLQDYEFLQNLTR